MIQLIVDQMPSKYDLSKEIWGSPIILTIMVDLVNYIIFFCSNKFDLKPYINFCGKHLYTFFMYWYISRIEAFTSIFQLLIMLVWDLVYRKASWFPYGFTDDHDQNKINLIICL